MYSTLMEQLKVSYEGNQNIWNYRGQMTEDKLRKPYFHPFIAASD